MKLAIEKKVGKPAKVITPLVGAKKLLSEKGLDVTSIERRADKNLITPLPYKPTSALKLLQSSRKKRLTAFAHVYAHYLILENRPAFIVISQSCAKKQGMTGTPRSTVSSSMLRCIMGFKKGSAINRKRQRQHISTVGRAIAHLKQKGITPDAVAAMMPGKGYSIRAWAAAYGGIARSAVSKQTHLVKLPALAIVTIPGGDLVLLGKYRGKHRVEVRDWVSLGRGSKRTKRTWLQIETLAKKNYFMPK